MNTISMITLAFVTQLLCVNHLSAADLPSSPSGEIGIIIGSNQTNYSAGERIILEVTLTNLSSEPVIITYDLFPATDYAFNIIGADQKQAPRTRMGEKVFSGGIPSRGGKGMRLEGGETRKFPVVLNQLFDLTLAQKYSIVVSRSFSGSTNATVKSKPIEIAVTLE